MTQQATSASSGNGPLKWRSEIEAALNETDSAKLLFRVHAAETAIFVRLQDLAKAPESSGRQAELREIAKALQKLIVLKREKLGFPDWEVE